MVEVGAIEVAGVSKSFHLPHERTATLKGTFLNVVKLHRNRSIEIQHVLDDISFSVKPGEFLGVVGRNGSGKSTLLKILAGIYQPTRGRIEVGGRLVPFIELGVGFNGELSGRDNVYLNGALLGFSKAEMDKMYQSIVEFAELEKFMDQKLKNYSTGMQVRLAFSVAIRAEADILLIDEVLAVGDASFQRKCFEYFKSLKKNRKTVVFVSHNMGAIREFCNRALLLEEGEVKAIGKADSVASKYGQLFIDGDTPAEIPKAKGGKRWGNGGIKIIEVKPSLSDDHVIIRVRAKVSHPLGGVVYGVHIVGQDGIEITAMNNRMIQQPDLNDLSKGDNVAFEWKILNIFNDGKYSVTLTLVDESGIALDWFTEAASFRIKRLERSTTAVLPPVVVTHRISK